MGREGITGVRAVHWDTSPACARFLEYLECRGDASPDQLSAACHAQPKYTFNLMLLMRRAGVVHVRAWRHNSNGSPTPIYRLGPGKNKPAPKPETAAQRCRRRRKSLQSLYGVHAASAILDSGRVKTRIVVDGRTLRPGDHDSQLAGKVSA